MSERVNITIPPKINYLDLGVHKTDNGLIGYNMSVFKELLTYNRLYLGQLNQDDVESILVMWYIEHRKQGGKRDDTTEALVLSVKPLIPFEPNIYWDKVIEPPTPEQIRSLRIHTGMTQAQVAKLLGLSNRQLIGDYENGVKSPTAQTWTLWLLLTGQHPTLTLNDRFS